MADTLEGLKIRAYDLAEEMSKLQDKWNEKQKELNQVNAEIKNYGTRPQVSPAK